MQFCSLGEGGGGGGENAAVELLRRIDALHAGWRHMRMPMDRWPITHLASEGMHAMRDGERFAVEGEEVVRMLAWAIMSEKLHACMCVAVHTDGHASLLAVYVDEALRRRGVGAKLVAAATAELRARRIRCEMPMLACVAKVLSSPSYEQMLIDAGWEVQRVDGVRRGEVGARVFFEIKPRLF